MSKIEFDSQHSVLYNANNANVYRDYLVINWIRSGITDIQTLFSRCGFSITPENAAHATLIQWTTNHYVLSVSSAGLSFSVPTGLCTIKFNDRTNTYSYTIQENSISQTVSLQEGWYGFDEVNLLQDPSLLYRRNSVSYFHRLNRSALNTNETYTSTSSVNPSGDWSIQGTPPYIDVPYSWCKKYSMPNYHMNGGDIVSIGLVQSITGSNPFHYKGKVFGAESNVENKAPADQFCYYEWVPEIIYWTGYVKNGWRCDDIHFNSFHQVVVEWCRVDDETDTFTVTYDLNFSQSTLIRYTRTPTSVSKVSVPESYIHVRGPKKSVNMPPEKKISLWGAPDATTTRIYFTIDYTNTMAVSRYTSSGSWVTNTDSFFENIVQRSRKYTASVLLPDTTGDWADKDKLFITIGNCTDGKVKQTTKYGVTLKATLDVLKGEDIIFPSTGEWFDEPHINTITKSGTFNVTNLPNNLSNRSVTNVYHMPIVFRMFIDYAENTTKGILPQTVNLYDYIQKYHVTGQNVDQNYDMQPSQNTYWITNWRENTSSSGQSVATYNMHLRLHKESSKWYLTEISQYYTGTSGSDSRIDSVDVFEGTPRINMPWSSCSIYVIWHKDWYMNPYNN